MDLVSLLATTPHHFDGHQHDYNLRGAYLHVLADALTSVLAIVALPAGKYWGANWLDPAIGIVGAALVARWSFGLIRQSSRVLLDRQADDDVASVLRRSIEVDSTDRITDLHVWSIGHGILSAQLSVVSSEQKPPSYYKGLVSPSLNVVHLTVEVQQCGS